MSKTSKNETTQQVDPAVAKDSNNLNNLFRMLFGEERPIDTGNNVAGFAPQQIEGMNAASDAMAAFGPAVGDLDPAGDVRPDFNKNAVVDANGIPGFSFGAGIEDRIGDVDKGYSKARTGFRKDAGKETKYKQFKPKGGGKK